EVLSRIVEKTNMPKVLYFTKESLSKWASDETRAEKLRNSLDQTGTLALGLNSPAQIKTQDFLALQNEYPDLSEYVQLNPEGPSPNSARVFADNLEAAEQKRSEIRKKLEVGE